MPQATAFIIDRRNDRPLEFRGWLLAEQSSHTEGALRWQEVRIWRTTTGKFVTQIIGRSIVEGEKDLPSVNVFDDAADVRHGLYRKHENREFMTDTAFAALEEAASNDDRIVVIDAERI